jgi:phosphoglycerol transferase MdoB-like AlkP superfamily enzyme
MGLRGVHFARPLWEIPAVRRLLVLLGLGIVLASLLADWVGGTAEPKFGWEQVLGCLVGFGFIASGSLLSTPRWSLSMITVRWIIAVYITSCAIVLWLIEPLFAATWILLAYIAAICLLIPLSYGALTFAVVVGLHLMLTWISTIKADLTEMPLTMLDVKIAVSNPAGLWDALSLPHASRYVAVAVSLLVLAGWVLMGLLNVTRFFGHMLWGKAATYEPLARALAISVLGLVVWFYLQSLYVEMGKNTHTWSPDRVARLADDVGIFPFMGYSYHIETNAAGDIYRSEDSISPPSRQDIQQSVLQFMGFPRKRQPQQSTQPNIVMVLAESTFDPSRAFRLQGEWNTQLFTEKDLTAVMGPLRVNTKGGGTWVAEFESIVGLDSRLFGYSGAYTHASLAPFVERSFVTYLEERGYESWAFLANGGEFYNTRRAYESYGFQRVLDSADLGSESAWFETDTAVIESIKTSLGPDPVAPFFSYITLIENHGPHECNLPDASRLAARFSDTEEFAANCILHEYLRRLDSTTVAVQSLIQYLKDIEVRTGRPFAVLIFGDHQPMTFTGSGKLIADFSPFRKSEDMYTTFFHVLSSARSEFTCCSTALPVAALPTLVSGFVANGPEDVYLGENLWLYERCGSDAIRRDFADNMSSLEVHALNKRPEVCDIAYQRALAAYRNSGVIRVTTAIKAER